MTEKSSESQVKKSWGAVILYVLKSNAWMILLLNKRVFKLSGLNCSKIHYEWTIYFLCAFQGNNLF